MKHDAENILGRAIAPCGAEYRAVDLLMRACGRPLGHAGHHFVHALPLEPVPDGAPPLGPVLDRAALPEPGSGGLVVLSAEEWQRLGRVLAAWEKPRERLRRIIAAWSEARERDLEDRLDRQADQLLSDREEALEQSEESWEIADAAIADAAARGEPL